MGRNWQLGKGSFTLGDYRFQIDPVSFPEDGKGIDLPQVYVKGLSGRGEVQAWQPSYSDGTQTFQWTSMPSEMFDEIQYYKEQAILNNDITFNFTYHNKTPEETWTVNIVGFTGTEIGNVWYNVSLSIRLLEDITV